MPGATANRMTMRYFLETLYGSVSGNPKFTNLRYRSESFKQGQADVESDEIRDDGQVPDVTRVSIDAMGGFAGRLSYGSYDDMFVLGLRTAGASLSAAWAAAVNVTATTISFAAASGNEQTISDSGNGLAGFTAGAWVKVSGAANAANNGYFKIKTVAAGSIVVYNPSGVVGAATPSITLSQGESIINGITNRSIAIEKQYGDLSNEFALLTGLVLNNINLSVAPGSLLDIGFEFMGSKEVSTTATSGDGSPTAAPTTNVMNAVDNITGIWLDGAPIECTKFDLNTTNNLRKREVIALLGAESIGLGNFQVRGGVTRFYESKAEMDKYLNSTQIALGIVLKDGAGNAYVMDVPAARFTSGERVAGGTNTDILAAMQWKAYRDSVSGYTMRIQRWAA